VLVSDVLGARVFSAENIHLHNDLRDEVNSFEYVGINFEEKALYDILLALAVNTILTTQMKNWLN